MMTTRQGNSTGVLRWLVLPMSMVCLSCPVVPAAPKDPAPRGGLRNHWAICAIGKSGQIGGIWDNISGRRLVQESFETYTLRTRDGKIITISEKDDVVHSAISSAPPPNRPRWGNQMAYFARNPKIPGSAIRKSYYFALIGEEQRIVCRSISITAPVEQPTLFSSVTTTILAPAFRKGSLYHYVVPQGVAGDQRPLIPAGQITTPLPRRDHGNDALGRAASDIFNPEWKTGLAQYLFRVGRDWVYPRGLHGQSYWTANGWKIASGGFFLADKASRKRNNRIEMRYHIFGESRLAVHEEYLASPELVKIRKETRPLPRMSQVRSPGTPKRFLRPGDKVPSFSLINIGSGGRGQFRYGQFATSDDARLEQVDPLDPKKIVQTIRGRDLKQRFASQRQENPHALGGMYIYRGHDSPVFAQHSDWILSRSPTGLVSTRPLPEVFDFETRGVIAESDYLGTELFYWDAALDSGQIDWERQHVSQTSSVLARWQKLYEALHQRNKLLWVNARTGSAFYDITYYEGSGAQRVPGKTWRDGADMDLMNKIYQVPGTMHVPLYWWTNGPQQNTQRYQNLCLALALSPRGGAWMKPVDGKFPRAPDDGVLHEVIDEFRDARFTRIGLEPAWWRDLETDVEAYTLRLGPTWFVNVMAHRKQSSTVTASIDVTRTTLDPTQPVFCWQHQSRQALVAGSQYPKDRADRYFTTTTLSLLQPGDKRLILPLVDVPPERTRLCTLSQVPAWITSADGIGTQLRLSQTLGSEIDGKVDLKNRVVTLETTGPRRLEIATWWNPDWGTPRVLEDETVLPYRIDRRSGQTLLVFELPAGTHSLQVAAK
ncbi:MAG: hypothetical protein CMJ65_06625 [Planctomycetaceae bacterium]|nr:hypothetical protein [Planctomycetaceae bacterium]